VLALVLLQTSVFGWGGGEECNKGIFQLFYFDEEDMVHFNDAALAVLSSPNLRERPIIVISVVGAYHSGKSFFLNSLTECPELFAVGSDVEAKTKGANGFLMEPSDIEGKKPVVLLVDTEGTGRQNKHDFRTLLFATLASSHIIYHHEKMEERIVRSLDAVSSLYREYGNEYTEIPSMTWIFEKFVLNEMNSPAKIREELLGIDTADGPQSEALLKEDTKARILRDLQKHEPFFIPPAIRDSKQWKNLTSFSMADLEGGYRSEIDQIRNLMKDVLPKRIAREAVQGSEPLTCGDYISYLHSIARTINSKSMKDFDPFELHELKRFVMDRAVVAGNKTCLQWFSSQREEYPITDHSWSVKNLTNCKKAKNVFVANSMVKKECVEAEILLSNCTENCDEAKRKELESILGGHKCSWYRDGLNNLTKNLVLLSNWFKNENVLKYRKRCDDACSSLRKDIKNVDPSDRRQMENKKEQQELRIEEGPDEEKIICKERLNQVVRNHIDGKDDKNGTAFWAFWEGYDNYWVIGIAITCVIGLIVALPLMMVLCRRNRNNWNE